MTLMETTTAGDTTVHAEITIHRSELIPGGHGARIGYSDDHPDRVFLIVPGQPTVLCVEDIPTVLCTLCGRRGDDIQPDHHCQPSCALTRTLWGQGVGA